MGTAANDKNGKISGLQIRSATGKLVCIKSNNKARKLNGERKRKESERKVRKRKEKEGKGKT